MDQDGEEVIVVVEGRSATYTKGDSTWTVEGEGGFGGFTGGGRGGGEVYYGDGSKDGAAGDLPAGEVRTSTNLDDLITGAIKEAAAERGVDYGTGETNVMPASWGQVKSRGR